MANSKRQTILEYLVSTTFAHITTGNGYNFSVGAIKRGVQDIEALPIALFPVVFLSRSIEERKNITQNQFESFLTVVVLGLVKSPGIENIQAELDKLIEDITKALERDRLLGGNSKWLEIKRVVADDGDLEGLAACAITVEIQYVSEGITP